MIGDCPSERNRWVFPLRSLLSCLLPVAVLPSVWLSVGSEVPCAPVPVELTPVSYRLEHTPKDTKPWRIVFDQAPPFIHALEYAPRRREAKLGKGTWLVLTFLVSSVPDIKSIDVAVRVVKRYKGRVHLGLRPMAQYKEMNAWFPDYRESVGSSPVLILFKDGRLQGWEIGPMTEKELATFLEKR